MTYHPRQVTNHGPGSCMGCGARLSKIEINGEMKLGMFLESKWHVHRCPKEGK